jgi:DNA polymerase-3 subunit delta
LPAVPSELKPAYLLTGSDRPKIARALSRLRARSGDDAVEHLSALDSSGDDVVAACNALGFFAGEARLVIVDAVDRWKQQDVAAIAAYLADPTPATVLALVGDGVKRESALAKACAKVGEVLLYDVTKRALPKWVAEQFGRVGATADPEACRALVEIVGDDVEELANEIEKVALWAGGEAITARDVEAVAAGRAETSIFALTDAWGRRDLAGVLKACESLLERAGGARREELTRLTALMASHLTRVRECQAYAAEGVTPREAAARMKKAPFYVEKLFAQAAGFGVEELRDAVIRLAALDLALKGGSKLPGDLELERALVELTREPEPAGRPR